jgi:hypothetical protein
MTVARRLAAILAADVAGYSRLMGADEEGTHERLKRCAANCSIRKSPSIMAASSRPPATECWWNLAASSMRCAARSRFSRGCPSATRASLQTAASNCASASISATSSSSPMTFMAMGSTSLRGSKPWPMPAGCSSPIRFMTTCATGCPLSSRIWASSRSRTSPGRCASTGSAMPPLRAHPHQLCRSPTSRRSRCCRSPI